MSETTATIVPRSGDASSRAAARWNSSTTTVTDGNGRRTVLQNGKDVDSLAVRRLHETAGTEWALDLMLGDQCVLRLDSMHWAFDREFGPREAAEASGLQLVHRPAELATEPAAVPDTRHLKVLSPLLLVLAMLSTIPLLVLLIVPPLRDLPWLAATTAALALPYLVQERWPRPRPGTVIFRARPSVAVPRAFARRADIIRDRDLLVIRTPGGTYSLPSPADACGPRELRRASTHAEPTQNADAVVLVSEFGRPLMWLGRNHWCAGRSDPDLARALGVAWSAEPIRADLIGRVASATGPRRRADPVVPLASVACFIAFVFGLGHDDPVSGIAVILGAIGTVLGLMTEIVLSIRALRGSQIIAVPREDADA